MYVDHRQGHLELVRSTLATLVYPLQVIVNSPVEFGQWASESFITQKSLLDEVESLRSEQQLLNSRLQRFKILEEENKRLRQLLGSTIDMDEKILIAELLAVELEQFRHMVQINKGTRDEVYSGQPVVDASGIIGQVIHAGAYSSKVIMITDPSHSLPVQLNRNGLRAIAVGTGHSNALQLEHLPTNSDIEVGDLIVSSGLGGRFPRGYPVGTISDIELEPGAPFAKVSVEPSGMLAQNREVLLIWRQDGVEVSQNQEQGVIQ